MGESFNRSTFIFLYIALLSIFLYHIVKNIFSQQIIYFLNENNEVSLNAQNLSKENFNGSYKIIFIDTTTGNKAKEISQKVTINKRSKIKIDSFSSSKYINDHTVMFAELYNGSGNLVNSNYFKTLPWKYYHLAKANISLTMDESKKYISVTSDKPSYFVDLYANGVEFSKRGFNIVNGEEIKVDILNDDSAVIEISDIKIFSLNNYLE